MNQTYNSKIYNAKKAFLYLFPIFILIISLNICFGILIQMPSISVVLSVGTCIAPFIFEKKIKCFFTKEVMIEFTEENFTMSVFNFNEDTATKKKTFYWKDIKSYKLYDTSTQLTYLDIFLIDGSFKELGGFKNNIELETSNSAKSVTFLFNSYIKMYNSNLQEKEKIGFSSGLINTRIGTFIIILLVVLIITSLVLHLVYNSKSFAFLITGVFLLISVLIKRKIDKIYKNQMQEESV